MTRDSEPIDDDSRRDPGERTTEFSVWWRPRGRGRFERRRVRSMPTKLILDTPTGSVELSPQVYAATPLLSEQDRDSDVAYRVYLGQRANPDEWFELNTAAHAQADRIVTNTLRAIAIGVVLVVWVVITTARLSLKDAAVIVVGTGMSAWAAADWLAPRLVRLLRGADHSNELVDALRRAGFTRLYEKPPTIASLSPDEALRRRRRQRVEFYGVFVVTLVMAAITIVVMAAATVAIAIEKLFHLDFTGSERLTAIGAAWLLGIVLVYKPLKYATFAATSMPRGPEPDHNSTGPAQLYAADVGLEGYTHVRAVAPLTAIGLLAVLLIPLLAILIEVDGSG